MGKNIVLTLVLFVFAVFSPAAITHAQESPPQQRDGLQIMTLSAAREQGDDYIRSMTWTFFTGDRERNRMKCDEIRKLYRGMEGINFKSVIRYREPSKLSRRSTLTWNYNDGRRDYWYFASGMTTAKRVSDLERIRSQAEVDFNLDDYVDINPDEERHSLLRSEAVEGKMCYLIESTPMHGKKKYGKRISFIDQQTLIPIRVEYFDRKGKLHKVLTIAWQQVGGIWYWKEAEAKNVQKNKKTFIRVDEIKVNTGVDEREFTSVALEKVK